MAMFNSLMHISTCFLRIISEENLAVNSEGELTGCGLGGKHQL